MLLQDVYAGDFTMTMITKFSGNRYTLLTRIFEMRERRQDIANVSLGIRPTDWDVAKV